MQHFRVPTIATLFGAASSLITLAVNFNTAGVAAGVKKVTVMASPAKPVLIEIFGEVLTPFNAATTNVLTAGTDATANQLLDANAFAEGAAGFTTTTTRMRVTANTDIFVKYTQSGTAATTGSALVYVRLTQLDKVQV